MAKPKNKKDQAYFRDRLTTVDSEGKRSWIYARKPKGKFLNRRRILALILLLFFYFAPFIRVHNEPLLLFNFLERKFIIFGTVFWPQDFHLVLLMFITALIFIILFTVIYGRIFCGWVCPQTIFMEFVFRRIEYWIEGNAPAQRKLDAAPWTFDKIWKKSLKHAVFFLISFITANTFLAYIIGTDELLVYYREGLAENYKGFIGLLIFSGAFYFIFAFFREQVCTIACPYGRLQGVLIDKKTVIVAYDYQRGEPRGPLNKTDGDCVDCDLCVQVCPTGIDIRNGTQLECINCTACIDACNSVMERVKKPKGLIRYDSEEGIETGHHHLFNARTIFYSVALTLMIFFVAALFSFRGDFEATILRMGGTLYQDYGTDSISNIYIYTIVNKANKPIEIDFKLLEPKGNIRSIGGNDTIPKGIVGKGQFLIVLAKDQVKHSDTQVKIGLYLDGEQKEIYHTTFVGPNALDKPKK
ncbi:MAG: cytochrome c oxidase accessory protein CcoG [Chlorobi bacterium]|nr:cytochrome c oxidase accessory protein CcoG [Chlorobiota bacterium]